MGTDIRWRTVSRARWPLLGAMLLAGASCKSNEPGSRFLGRTTQRSGLPAAGFEETVEGMTPPSLSAFHVQARGFARSDFDDQAGDLAVQRLRVGLSRTILADEGRRQVWSLSHEASTYDFGGGGALGSLGRVDDVAETSAGVMYSAPAGKGTWFTAWNLNSGTTDGAHFGDGLYLEGGVGYLHPVHDDLSIGVGLFGHDGLEDDIKVFPFPLIQWQIGDQHRIGFVRASDPGVGYTYTLDSHSQFYAALGVDQRQYRIDDDIIGDAAFVDQETGIRLGWLWRPSPAIRTDLFLGVARRTLSLDVDETEVRDDDLEPAGYLGLAASFTF